MAATLGCAAASAHAESWFSLEAGLGATSATKEGDGMYYNAGLSHKTPVNSFGARAGVQFNVIDAPIRSWVPGLRLHLTYAYWGKLNWDATVAEDKTMMNGKLGGYDTATRSCFNNQCGQIRQFLSSGNTQSINLTIEPFWNIGHDWTVGIEAGPAIYFGPWTSRYVADEPGPFGPTGSSQYVSHRVVPHLGALVGASMSKGPFSLRYEYLFAPPRYTNSGTDVPSGIRGVHMLTANYTY